MAENADDKLMVPIGPGGVPGRIFRFIMFLLTVGMLFPNVCVEGMNLTKMQREQEGKLYDKV